MQFLKVQFLKVEMSEGLRDSGSEGSKALVSSCAGDVAAELDPKGVAGVVGDRVREGSRDKRSSLRS